jgi:hypothetical protein
MSNVMPPEGRGYCSQCRFCGTKVASGSNIVAFVCRFNPPSTQATLAMMREGPAWQVACVWPEVTRDDWCGKFEPQGH